MLSSIKLTTLFVFVAIATSANTKSLPLSLFAEIQKLDYDDDDDYTYGYSEGPTSPPLQDRPYHTGSDDLATMNDDVRYNVAHNNDWYYFLYHDDGNFHHPENFNFNLESACDGDVSSCACEEGQTKLTVEVKICDSLYSYNQDFETAFEIKDSTGQVVIQNDKFNNNDIDTTSYCLHGCDDYSFTMIDRGRNGIYGDGYYKLTINDATANTYTGGTGVFYKEIVVLSDEFTCPAVTEGGGGGVEGGVRCISLSF